MTSHLPLQRTRQHAKIPRGEISRLLERGRQQGLGALEALRALPSYTHIAVLTSGNPGGATVSNRTLAHRSGTSVRTLQRRVKTLEQISELKVRRTGRIAKDRDGPNTYKLPQVARDEDGPVIGGSLLEDTVFREASSVQQGLWLWLYDRIGPNGWILSASTIASETGADAETVRDALRYFRRCGWLQTEERASPRDQARLANRIRIAVQFDGELPEPAVALQGVAAVREDKKRKRLATLTRGLGLAIAAAELDQPGCGWWDELAEPAPREDAPDITAGLFAQRMRTLRQAKRYSGTTRTRDVRAVIPRVLARRDVYEREALERSGRAPAPTIEPGVLVRPAREHRGTSTAAPQEVWERVRHHWDGIPITKKIFASIEVRAERENGMAVLEAPTSDAAHYPLMFAADLVRWLGDFGVVVVPR